ncbi:hypothetical protein Q3G72_029667 [Acer saccharum]|nr:hypothetical protein Q3G72_029667 [Acer saccharum]
MPGLVFSRILVGIGEVFPHQLQLILLPGILANTLLPLMLDGDVHGIMEMLVPAGQAQIPGLLPTKNKLTNDEEKRK